jgi:hypothetical protein
MELKHLIATLCFLAVLSCHVWSLKLAFGKVRLSHVRAGSDLGSALSRDHNRPNDRTDRSTKLHAKKKGGAAKLVSDDLLSLFDEEDDTPSSNAAAGTLNVAVESPPAKKEMDKKKGKSLVSDSLLDLLNLDGDGADSGNNQSSSSLSEGEGSSIIHMENADDDTDTDANKKKKKKKKKKKGGGLDFSNLEGDNDEEGSDGGDGGVNDVSKVDLSSFDLPGLEKEGDDKDDHTSRKGKGSGLEGEDGYVFCSSVLPSFFLLL